MVVSPHLARQHNPTRTSALFPREQKPKSPCRHSAMTPMIAAAPGMTSTLGATITNAKFKGFNVTNGAVDPAGNGCDVTVQNLAFTGLSVKWQTAAFPPIAPPPAQAEPAARPVLAAPTTENVAERSADFRIE